MREGSPDVFAELVATSPMGMLVTSPEGRITYANAAALALAGRTAEEVGTLYIFELVAPDDLDARPLDQRRLEPGAPVDNERPIMRPDGTRVWVKSTSHRLPNGQILLWLRDLSEQRSLETQFREAQKLETVGLLAAGLAHDLNNLLTVVTGHAELVRVLGGDGQTRESADCIATASARAADLTRKLLAFGRRQPLKPRPFDLGELVEKNLPLIRSMAGERIEVVITSGPAEWVEADPTQVEQALWNLVTNACQAMAEGGRLTLGVRDVELDARELASLARPRPDPRFVALHVEDTGRGMDEATQRRAFDPFFTTKESGSGLGLSVVHGVVGQSGGLVRLTSHEGQGSRFEMCFPRSDARPDRPTSQRPPATVSGSGLVLLVEDQELVRTWLVAALERRGFRVRALPSAEAALAEPLSEAPRVLVTDVQLPRLLGTELALRMRERFPGLPVLFITGYAHEADLRTLPRGAELLLKPFTATALVDKLALLCGAEP